jgi:cytochrome c-type biogenesis protein CcsB
MKFLDKIFSMAMALIVMLIFAISIGTATFIENDYGTQTARALIYNAKWFEVLLLYFCLIVAYNIFRFKMYKRTKWGQLTLHLALLLIGIGAFITRYIGYEGILHIREGETKNFMVSDKMILNITLKDKNQTKSYEFPLFLSSLGKNNFKTSISLNGKKLDIKLLKYLPSAKKIITKNANKKNTILEMKIASKTGAEDIFLKKGESKKINGILISFEDKKKKSTPSIYIFEENNTLFANFPGKVKTLDMATQKQEELNSGKHTFFERRLYMLGDTSIVLRKVHKNSVLKWQQTSLKPGNVDPQMLFLELKYKDKTKKVHLSGRRGVTGRTKVIDFGDLKVAASYGAKVIALPFSIKLIDFELERYPGSMSPASYSSYVRVFDGNTTFPPSSLPPYHIYMNHVLDYKGFRFFQSSYDMDERGSVLSVNHDPGTLITYIGYFLLALGFLWSYLTKNGRFQALRRKLEKLQEERKLLISSFAILLALFSSTPTFAASNLATGVSKEELKTIQAIPKSHTEKFARLIVQDNGGRMKPIDTLATEILSKISRKSSILGLDHNQILLGMTVFPKIYQKLRIIKVSHPGIIKKLGLPKGSKYASFNDFFENKNYKLASDIQIATRKKSAQRNQYDKEIIKVDERLNVEYMVFQGLFLKIFPLPGDKNNKWFSPIEAMQKFPPEQSKLVRALIANYFLAIEQGVKQNNWTKADEALKALKGYQAMYGKAVLPSKQRVEMEIKYNRLNIFNSIVLVYILVGLILLILAFVNIVKPKFSLKWPVRIALIILIATFLLHTFGLGLRWYVAQHAPWSNAYESILYIAWATALAGFVFSKRSPITLAATSILAGIFLFVAHLNWLDPQITNLVPVLQSYWLMIHVAVITASYGFLALGALLGMFVMVLFILRGKDGNPNIDLAIKELTVINEMGLLIGLGLVTVGNFLGGVWANESWGRYWGWDPKETWAAVTILVYAVVVHMRFIPALRGIFAFNVASILAYSSVIMTYFGVNYYLSGMHSYAAGDPVPIPSWVLPAVLTIFALILFASKNRKIDAKL